MAANVRETMLEKLNYPRHNRMLCDVLIVTNDGRTYNVDKELLCSNSQYLKRKLSSFADDENNEEVIIRLDMISSRSCELLLDLLYSRKVALTTKDAAEVLLAADVLDLKSVSDFCRICLRRGLVSTQASTDNCQTVLSNMNGASSESRKNGLVRSSYSKHDRHDRRSSLHVTAGSRVINITTKRPISAPSLAHDTSDICERSPVNNNASSQHQTPPVNLSKAPSDSIQYHRQPSPRMSPAADRGSKTVEHVKIKTEVQLSPHTYDNQYQPLSRKYDEASLPSSLLPDLPHPMMLYRNSIDGARSAPGYPLENMLSQKHKAARLEQAGFYNPRCSADSVPIAGLNPAAFYSLWASMLHLERLNYKYSSQSHAIRDNYPRDSRIVLPCQICRMHLPSGWHESMHSQFCEHGAGGHETRTPDDRLHLKRKSVGHVEREDFEESIPKNVTGSDRSNPIVALMNLGPRKTNHTCYHCKKEFDSIFLLRKHKSSEHVKRPFRCHVCEAAFPNKAGLAVHIRSHTGERPYQCKICNKSFTQLGHVQRHQKVHTGEKPYQCPLCHARVRDKASMHYHLLAHQGVKPFQCDLCDARFTKRSSLVKHKNVHTGYHLYQCSQCKASFRERASLSRHARSQHKDFADNPMPDAPTSILQRKS